MNETDTMNEQTKEEKKSVRETTKFIQNLYISIQFEIPLNLFHFDYIASIE